jgi:DNA-binding CsgD family transcriptional regulator
MLGWSRIMNLVERDRELAALDALLSDSARSAGGVAVIDGPLASGKTALLHVFAERAVARGAAFVSAAASRAEHPLLLGVLDQIRHGVRALLPDEGRPADGDGATDPMLTEVHQSLATLAQRRPVIVGIDDAHLADVGSLQCLIPLMRLLSPFRVLFVFSGCLQSQQAHWLLRAEIARMPRCTNITLKPLSQAGIEQLIAAELGSLPARLLAAECHRASGGNPLLARALIDDNRSTAADDARATLVIGDAYGGAMLSCLYRSEPGVLELARTLAALGESASTPLLSRLLDIDPESTALAVDALNVAGLLHAHRFPHERARAAVLGSMAPSALRAIHGKAAKLLHEDGAAPQAVARHLIAADSPQPWAVPVLEQAAERQLVDGQTSAAVKCLRLARRACTDERQHAAITSALTSAVWRMDPAAVERYLPELTTAVRNGHLGARHAGRLCGQLLWHGQPTEAADLLAGLDEIEAPFPMHRLDEVQLWLPLLYPGLGGRCASNPSAAGDNPHRLAAAVLAGVLSGTADDASLAELERLLGRTRLSGGTLIPIALALMALCYAERFAEARSWGRAFLAENTGHVPLWTAILETVLATVCLHQGELADAERLAHHALHLISARSWGVAVGGPLSVLIAAETMMGRLEKAADYLSVPIPDATFHTLFGAHYLLARGRLHLATGHVHAALQNFEACGGLVRSWGFDCPTAFPWRTNAALALLARDMTGAARGMVEQQLARLPELSAQAGIALRVSAQTLDPVDRVPPLLRSAKILEAHDAKVELAFTLADLGAVRAALGETEQADSALVRARSLAEHAGALPLVHALRGAQVAGGGGTGGGLRGSALAVLEETETSGESTPAARAVLSDAERRVAVLAAAGHTNRQIAHKLFITVSTVEQHLTKIYRKLSVSRRADLLARLNSETRELTVG